MATQEVKKSFSIALDIKKAISNREFEVVEGDNANTLHITLTDGGEAVDLTGCRVLAIFSKSNGTSSQDSAAADGGITIGGAANNEITIDLFTTSFAPGIVECEIQVLSGADLKTLATSAKFNFSCRRGILNADTITATNEYPMLVALIDDVEKVENAETLRVNAESGRASAEAARATAENARAQAESARNTAESARVSTENARSSAETTRVQAEGGRAAAETARVSAEDARQSASDSAVQRANTAAEVCENLAQSTRHASTHAAGGTDPVTPASIGAAEAGHSHSGVYEQQRLQFSNVSVPAASFVSDSTYLDYGYAAGVALSGVTADMTPEVVFACEDAAGGKLAPVAECYAGGVKVYASEAPGAAVTIATLVCWKAVA